MKKERKKERTESKVVERRNVWQEEKGSNKGKDKKEADKIEWRRRKERWERKDSRIGQGKPRKEKRQIKRKERKREN